MRPFETVYSNLALLDKANVDTDVIMPKQYLKSISRFGYGDWAFEPWRYTSSGDLSTPVEAREKVSSFSLNLPTAEGAEILLTRENFGCGSSREHAVWGIRDMGFKVIIASSFGDIFFSNCINNGILPVVLSEEDIQTLFDTLLDSPENRITVSLQEKRIFFDDGRSWHFSLDTTLQQRLLAGHDMVARSLTQAANIRNFEATYRNAHPYMFKCQEKG